MVQAGRIVNNLFILFPFWRGALIFTIFFLSFIELTKTNSTGSTSTTTRNFIPLSKLQGLLMLTSHLTYPSLYILVAEATPYVRNHRCVLIGLQPFCKSRIEKKALRQVERISRAVQPLQQHTDWSLDCIRRVCRGPNFSPFNLSALSAGINAVQFHSLNSAFPGQSHAFTEFRPNTPNSKKNLKAPLPINPSFHPLFMLLQF